MADNPDLNNSGLTRAQGRRKSKFPAATEISEDATLDFVAPGVNFKITKQNFIDEMGATGTIVQDGAATGTPVLDKQGTVNKIRNLEDGPGVIATISPENGITLKHNFSPGSGGVPIFTNITEIQPTIRSLAAGDGIAVSAQNGSIVVSLSGVPVGSGVVIVNSPDDFPDAVAGVRELVPSPGDQVVYLIAAFDIDMGSDTFTVTGGEVVIRGVHRTASRITTSSSGTMFTAVDSAFFQEFVAFDCPNAKWLDYTNPALGFNTFANQNVIIVDCDTLGTIDGAFVTSLRTMTVVATQTGGFTWTGTTNGQLNMSTFLGLSWAGTLIDLGTATFDIINISANNRYISPGGTTILSGLAASGNLTSGGRGLVSSNLFNGTGTAINGIETEDLQWEFHDNIFADNTTQNTRMIADAFLTASETATIGSIGVYVAVGGTNWDTDIDDRFTVSTAGLITYIGLGTIDAEITAFSTVAKVGGGSDKICSKIAINGTVQDKTVGCTENATPTGVTSAGIFTLVTADTIQLFVANEDSTSDVVVSESSIIVKGG